ncbi:MAG: CidA/LrgA family protein [Pseudomonadota bacterium]
MNFLHGITLLLIYQLVGELSVLVLRIPIPGPVLGMVLLLLTLLWRGSSSASLDTSSTALLSHLSLLFVPAGVGMMVHLDQITHEWLPITITLLLSTVITMMTTAAIMLAVSRLLSRGSKKND